ncbi:hypothetical protein BDV95DRAFT_304964 [Massariosphaeria phaeospora]|uniref:Uncharacterized protein n=1 Tax=Massariosphaeria phaeospora TaxID=100035 RepID=A0A7C8IEK0_9PLEO|nr:hypothetical protein BDV95DRAFT_304964 [Massariosphaeria phaeospora]
MMAHSVLRSARPQQRRVSKTDLATGLACRSCRDYSQCRALLRGVDGRGGERAVAGCGNGGFVRYQGDGLNKAGRDCKARRQAVAQNKALDTGLVCSGAGQRMQAAGEVLGRSGRMLWQPVVRAKTASQRRATGDGRRARSDERGGKPGKPRV